MAYRSSLRKGNSKRVFRRTSGTHEKNLRARPMRGGWRL